MPNTSPTPSFDPGAVLPWWKDRSGLAEYLREASLFLRGIGTRLKAGEHSRSPLRLLRFQLGEDCVWCDWIARDPDEWDSLLPPSIGQRHASVQALKDAIDTRALLFSSLPGPERAYVRAFRKTSGTSLELILHGEVRRSSESFRHVHSLAMRAKLLGFQFVLEDETLRGLCEDSMTAQSS
jgi:hypothetical protein